MSHRPPVTSELSRDLSLFHITMMGLGMMIGAGIFLGTGRSIAYAGPGGVLLTFALIGAIGAWVAIRDPSRLENFTPFLNREHGGWSALFVTMGFTAVAFEGYEVIAQADAGTGAAGGRGEVHAGGAGSHWRGHASPGARVCAEQHDSLLPQRGARDRQRGAGEADAVVDHGLAWGAACAQRCRRPLAVVQAAGPVRSWVRRWF